MVPSQCPQMVCCTYLIEEDVVFSVCATIAPHKGVATSTIANWFGECILWQVRMPF